MNFELVFMSSAFVAMLGGIWKIADHFRNQLQSTEDLLFRRFDEHKDKVDDKMAFQIKLDADTYMRKENCDLTQKIYANEVVGIKDEIQKIHLKLDRLLEGK